MRRPDATRQLHAARDGARDEEALNLPHGPKAVALGVAVCLGLLGFVFALWLNKYPYFSPFPTTDFQQHPELAESALAGQLPFQLFYYGGDYVIAFASWATGESPVVSTSAVSLASAVLLGLSIYWLASSLTGRRSYGLVCVALYVLTGGVWYIVDVNVGLVDNSFAMIADCLILGAYARYVGSGRLKWLGALMAVAVLGLFTHYTVVTVFPVILAYPLLLKLGGAKLGAWREEQILRGAPTSPLFRALQVDGLLAIGAAAILVLRPSVVSAVRQVVLQTTQGVIQPTALSSAFSWSPFFYNLYALMQDDVASLFLTASCVVCVYLVAKGRAPSTALLLIGWFLPLLVVGNLEGSLWRYSIEGALPFLLIGAYPVTEFLFPVDGRRSPKLRARKIKYLGVLLLLVTVGSPLAGMVADSVTHAGLNAQNQGDVYASMVWMKSNLPPGANVLSMSDFDYWYCNDVNGLSCAFDGLVHSPNQLETGSCFTGYVVVTDYYPHDQVDNYTEYFQGLLHQEVYHNGEVSIYNMTDLPALRSTYGC